MLQSLLPMERGGALRQLRFRWIYQSLGYLQGASIFFGGLVTALLKAKPADFQEHFGSSAAVALETIQQSAWIITPGLLIIAWLLRQLRNEIGDPVIWDELQKQIDDYRKNVFSDAGSGIRHHRRVTLFKHVRWCTGMRCWPWRKPWPKNRAWPWHGWLVPVARSGHTTQSSGTNFRVPYYREEDAEGVAGLAWISEGWIKRDELPDVRDERCSEERLQEYALQTRMDLTELKAHRAQGRAFSAVRVEVKGKAWGVLVIDSRSPTLPHPRAKNHFKSSFSGVLSLLLPRI